MNPRGIGKPGTGLGREGEAGFVLLSVLGILAVVSAILAGALLQVRSGTALTQARGRIVQLQGIADGITRLIAYDLGVRRAYRLAGLDFPEDGTVVACPLGGSRTAFVSLQDQGRLIDLNRTPRPAMEDAFRLLGVPDRAVLAVAAEIVDYRDADDVPEPTGGAELPQYRGRGLPWGPRNVPFAGVDEIERLPSMTPDIAAILRPVLTVYNEGGRFDLAALVARLRPSHLDGSLRQAGPVPSPRQYFRMSVVVEQAGTRAGRSAIYALGGTRTGTDFLSWQQASAVTTTAALSHRACATVAAALRAGGPE
ncbi:hypothetical protein LPLAFNJD_LOCUS946 [Methylorubrum aminovorans]